MLRLKECWQDLTEILKFIKNKGWSELKKIISMLLVITLLVTFIAPVAASSSATSDKGLENAIKAVKGKITIPADNSKFSYSIYNQSGTALWNLSWSNEEAQKYINVTVDENGFISNFSSYQYNSGNDKKIPKYSKSQGKEIAEKFIKKLDSKLLQDFKYVEDANSQERDYNYSYERQVNGIPFPANRITVVVNNYTGEVSNFNCSYSKDMKFEASDKIITLEQAKQAFIQKLGLKLVYNIKSADEKSVSYLAYVPKDSNKYIDAITGNVEKIPNQFRSYSTASTMAKEAAMDEAGGGAIILTPEEQDAVKGMSGLLGKEELDNKIRGISQFKLDSGFTLVSAELRKDWRNKDSFIWYLRYSKVLDKEKYETRELSVSVDAKSGEFIDFWTNYSSPQGTKPQKTKDEAQKLSDEFVKNLLPSYFSNTKLDDTYYTYDEKQSEQYNFRYVRIENGLECPADFVTVSYDNLSGNINSFNIHWTKDLKFDDPKKAIAVEKAYEVLFDNSKLGFGIEYVGQNSEKADYIAPVQTEAVEAVLGYFIENSKPCIISAETGDVLNYSGTVYNDGKISDYTDIKGLYAENQVKILTQLSIKYFENELKANDQLLQKDYLILLSKLNDTYYFDSSIDKEKAVEKMYTNLINAGIITKAEKNPASVLTREEAAKFFVKFLGLSKVAELKGIYKSDFKDAGKISPELLGYVSIASGFKAMNGSNGNFNPKNKMTRLEGLLSIYSYLAAK